MHYIMENLVLYSRAWIRQTEYIVHVMMIKEWYNKMVMVAGKGPEDEGCILYILCNYV